MTLPDLTLRRKRTTGFKPLRAGRIHLRCPKCGRKFSNMMRHEDGTDPEEATLVEITCLRCGQGDKDDEPRFYDGKGREVDWEPEE